MPVPLFLPLSTEKKRRNKREGKCRLYLSPFLRWDHQRDFGAEGRSDNLCKTISFACRLVLLPPSEGGREGYCGQAGGRGRYRARRGRVGGVRGQRREVGKVGFGAGRAIYALIILIS